MKYIDEFRDNDLIIKLSSIIKRVAIHNYVFMEVCGGHTAAIHRFGIPSMLPPNIRLLSGPGCPVCVTGTHFIDKAITLAGMSDVVIATYGDLLRVPGSKGSLLTARLEGADIRIVFSALEALTIAKLNPGRRIIFPGIGFETTAPGTAVTIKEAAEANIENFFLLCGHKLMPPAMEAILKGGVRLNGFICPGHVAAVTGSEIFDFIPEKYDTGCVITGFEPVDLLQAILMLILQVNNNRPGVEIQYSRAVTVQGNLLAKTYMSDVFESCDTLWRGLGIIPGSGLALRDKYRKYNVDEAISVTTDTKKDNELCICGDILRGLQTPSDCSLFGTVCLPENPVGACMVSGEGSCNTYYKYRSVNG